jgi:hypothetical protein
MISFQNIGNGVVNVLKNGVVICTIQQPVRKD